jgi:pimeloyl-ACP methyl ester carboxylesterase
MPTCEVNGLQMGYEIRGQGPPVMLVAGTAGSKADWRPDAVGILAEDFAVITFDHRGTGLTPGTPGLYTTRMFAADALGLLAALDVGPAHIVGHSMGGRVAQWIALDSPDSVRSLVLASSGPGEYPGQFEDGRPMMRGIPLRAACVMIEQGYDAWFERYMRESTLTETFQKRHPERADEIVAEMLAHAPTPEDYLKHTIARQLHQTTELLDRIQHPVLVTIGGADRDVGGTGNHYEQSVYLAEHLPNATFHEFPGLRHNYFWEAPELSMGRIREWLRERERERSADR